MRTEKDSAERLAAYSDGGVFAMIVTIMVLELKAPEEPAFAAMWPLWPTFISYAVELRVHCHHLDQPPLLDAVPGRSDPRTGCGLTSSISSWCPSCPLQPPGSRGPSSPRRPWRSTRAYSCALTSEGARRVARRRSLVVLATLTAAMLVALVAPRLAFGLICVGLILHLRPDITSRRVTALCGKALRQR